MQKVRTTHVCLAALLLLSPGLGCGKDNGGGSSDDPLPAFPTMPSEKEERKKIDKTVAELQTALEAQDVEASVALFVPEVQGKMKQWLQANQDVMADLAAPLADLPLSSLSEEEGWAADGERRRSADIAVSFDGKTFYVGLEKIDGVSLPD